MALRKLRVACALAGFVAAAACTGGSMALDGRLVGSWGGTGVSVVLTDTVAVVEFDCAHGRFGPVLLEDGRFDLAGTWTQETGAIRVGEGPEEEPANYSGVTTGDRLVFTVHVAGQAEPFGPFTAHRDTEPLLRKCL